MSNDEFDATLKPRYTTFFTFSISLPSILIDGRLFVYWIKTLVLLRLMVRPESEHADEN